MELFDSNYEFRHHIRSLGVSVSDFDFEQCEQYDLGGSVEKREKQERLETVVDTLKRRFGNYCLQRACQLERRDLSGFNPHDEHIIHPIAYRT
jgi:DNA polymerase-4